MNDKQLTMRRARGGMRVVSLTLLILSCTGAVVILSLGVMSYWTALNLVHRNNETQIVRAWRIEEGGCLQQTMTSTGRFAYGHRVLWSRDDGKQVTTLSIGRQMSFFAGGMVSMTASNTIPLWIPLIIFLIYPLYALIAATRRWRRGRIGRCRKCGYDLTGNVSGLCPECGTPIPAPAGPKPA